MKKVRLALVLIVGCFCVSVFAKTDTFSISNKMIKIESNEHFKLLGDMQTTTGTKDGKDFKETKQLDTKNIALYPSKLSNREKISGTGYLYICKVRILNQEWHPTTSKRLLGNIGSQMSKGLGVPLRSTSDSRINPAGTGMFHLLQGDKATMTLILISTEDKQIFHLCGTYTEAK